MDNQPIQNPDLVSPVTAPPASEPKKSNILNSKLLKIVVVVLIFLFVLVGGLYLLGKKQATKVVMTPTPTPAMTAKPATTNLNPNTGNLYGDIKVRLQEVLK